MAMTADEDDGNGHARVGEPALQLESGRRRPGKADVEHETGRPGGNILREKLVRRRKQLHLMTGLLAEISDRGSDLDFVINDINCGLT
jgi:hypothetical protein